mmetsp:Transcript_4514/g.9479  ORF Transcript_4514/g.9479 Transcript_4514/m.9479 type:complete len:132 (+) Transcript_4514:72-467(+)
MSSLLQLKIISNLFVFNGLFSGIVTTASQVNVEFCDDVNTCCYWPCHQVVHDHDGTEVGLKGNCGYNCFKGDPDIWGTIHPQFYMWHYGYMENHVRYKYGDVNGPLRIEGEDRNMYTRCVNACFASPPTAA